MSPPPPVAVGGGDNYAHRIVSESVGERGDYIATKIRYSRDRFVRQFMTHGELSPRFLPPIPRGRAINKWDIQSVTGGIFLR